MKLTFPQGQTKLELGGLTPHNSCGPASCGVATEEGWSGIPKAFRTRTQTLAARRTLFPTRKRRPLSKRNSPSTTRRIFKEKPTFSAADSGAMKPIAAKVQTRVFVDSGDHLESTGCALTAANLALDCPEADGSRD